MASRRSARPASISAPTHGGGAITRAPASRAPWRSPSTPPASAAPATAGPRRRNLQQRFTAAGFNLARIDAWLAGAERAPSRGRRGAPHHQRAGQSARRFACTPRRRPGCVHPLHRAALFERQEHDVCRPPPTRQRTRTRLTRRAAPTTTGSRHNRAGTAALPAPACSTKGRNCCATPSPSANDRSPTSCCPCTRWSGTAAPPRVRKPPVPHPEPTARGFGRVRCQGVPQNLRSAANGSRGMRSRVRS